MRAPRYRFSDEVRSTTRTMASRMIQDGTIAGTPEQLDAWILQTPEIREPLEKGGYNAAFTSEDLLPLLQAMVAHAQGSPPRVEAPPPSSKLRWVVGLLLVLALVLVLAVATNALR